MSTIWKWVWKEKAITPAIDLTVTLASDDPEQIALVEESAKANGIILERIEGWPAPKPLPADYWETAE